MNALMMVTFGKLYLKENKFKVKGSFMKFIKFILTCILTFNSSYFLQASSTYASVKDPKLLFIINQIKNHMNIKENIPVYKNIDLEDNWCTKFKNSFNATEYPAAYSCDHQAILLEKSWNNQPASFKIRAVFHELHHHKQNNHYPNTLDINQTSSSRIEKEADLAAAQNITCHECLTQWKDKAPNFNTSNAQKEGYLSKQELQKIIKTKPKNYCKAHTNIPFTVRFIKHLEKALYDEGPYGTKYKAFDACLNRPLQHYLPELPQKTDSSVDDFESIESRFVD